MSEDPGVYGSTVYGEDLNRAFHRLRRRISRLEIFASVLFVLVFAAGLCQGRAARAERREIAVRLQKLYQHHNALIEALNRRATTTGGRLEALGVPHGRLFGDALDSILPPRRGPDPTRR